MSLVAYSDSEGSEDESAHPKAPPPKSATPSSNNFAVHKTNPRKIQVKLYDIPSNDDTNREPAAKRPRIGASAFSGFNAMLPAPKRDADAKNAPKPAARKVFSLKTGAEPGFSREADAEMRQLFAEQETGVNGHSGSGTQDQDETLPSIPKRNVDGETSTPTATPPKGNPFMFKPLSVARNNKKSKRKADGPIVPKIADGVGTASLASTRRHAAEDSYPASASASAPAPKKVSLFGMGVENTPEELPQVPDEEDEIVEVLDDPVGEDLSSTSASQPATAPSYGQGQSLDAIASDLGLSKADRRQLFGRRGNTGGTAINVINFNIDQEYAANEDLRAAGEQVQHNPVRAIAPGKHNLKQLLNAATTQKDALEESFATGRRNKKEAGNKYGW
ncbi:hypothetical protein PV08_05784 [Exophiala spinifera]|uniref:Mitotic checkpoint regulator, MAD2B-interacting-domain-containing protein n=1 Tax=Exophiala spinifera TaxID=91928 RepID=A0A0D2BWR0_9EURO|nr:uncharacterized protein PV08_05784 [Exophiala spinifera]KIW15734.1 hypothetical protein PV08_05784 [Exophiala spinifera]